MFSQQDLQVIDAVARRGSFTAAADELCKVPSAISYTVRNIEERLAVNLFIRLHRKVKLTPAGEYFVIESRKLLKQMAHMKFQTQRVANGWNQSVSLALDNVVHEGRINTMVGDFYTAFPDVELLLTMEVYNGVWDALVDSRADIAIGATATIPVSGGFDYRSMGELKWTFVISPKHPLAKTEQAISNEELAKYPVICLEDTARKLPKRTTWLLENQRRLVVPNWHSATQLLKGGLGIAIMPAHMANKLLLTGELIEKEVITALPVSDCCLAWNTKRMSPAVEWLLDYLGDSDQLHQQWLE